MTRTPRTSSFLLRSSYSILPTMPGRLARSLTRHMGRILELGYAICRAPWGAFTREARPERSTISCVLLSWIFAIGRTFGGIFGATRGRVWRSPPVSVGFPTSTPRFRREIVRADFLSPCTMPLNLDKHRISEMVKIDQNPDTDPKSAFSTN